MRCLSFKYELDVYLQAGILTLIHSEHQFAGGEWWWTDGNRRLSRMDPALVGKAVHSLVKPSPAYIPSPNALNKPWHYKSYQSDGASRKVVCP